MNGTIWNGNTQLSTVTARSNTFNFTASSEDQDPCHPLTWTPLRSLADPGYSPLRITSPPGGTVYSQADLGDSRSRIFGTITGSITAIDTSFDVRSWCPIPMFVHYVSCLAT
jgi:hypothetical protein